jgi:PAS domain S-box-containing protein
MSNNGANSAMAEALREIESLRARLEESEEALRAIRSGEIDALVLPGPDGEEVFTLKSTDRAFRVLVEQMREGAVVVSETGSILYANRRFAHMLALPPEEIVGRTLVDFLVAEDRAAVETLLRQAHEGHDSGEFRLWVNDGAEVKDVPVYLSASVFEMEGQPAVGLLATDLTDQKRSEQLAAANLAKDHFLAMLSHELRTPLSPVLSTVQLMETDATLSREQRESLGTIRRNVEMEARLIDDLLDLTRISRGKVELRQEVVDAHATLKAALEISQGDIAAKHLEVSLALWAERHHVWADPARLQQVCWNLVKNAVKFTPNNGRISFRSCDLEGGRLRIEIADSGIGIDPQTLPKLFSAFEQGDRQMTRRFGGLGLGLTISKALVDLHRGSLTAASAGRNLGATFTLELKTVVAEAERIPTARAPANCSQRECRILLVDDHEDTLRVMARLLKGLGYLVKTANAVRPALEAANAEQFDLLISDIGLPDGSGLDIMQQVKARHHVKGIAISGFGMDDDLRRSREAGFNEHLTKPVNFQTLEDAIRRVIA